VLRSDGIEVGDMSQGPGFFFVDLRHVVTDDLDLHDDEMRFRGVIKLMRTHSFLNTVRLKGNEPSKGLRKQQSRTPGRIASPLPFATSLLFESWKRVGGN
jgi:hypothetical protein